MIKLINEQQQIMNSCGRIKMKNGNKTKTIKIILLSFLVIVITSASIASGYVYYTLNSIKINKIAKDNVSLGIKPAILKPKQNKDDEIENIALFGVDTGREKYEAAHSDSVMILSIDKLHKKIKLSSLMRDLYVNIDDHDMNKLNAAYAYGGPQLAIKTLNKNFDLNIKEYVTANFSGLSKIIDSVGGVEIDVKDKEIDQVNKYMKEVAKIRKETPTPIFKSGIQLLNGNQAVAYARIRKVGNGDFERTERQKTVLLALFKKIKIKSLSSYPFIASKFLSCLETSMSKAEILKCGSDVLSLGISNVDWCRFPLDGYSKGERINKKWFLTADIKVTTKHIHDFIYNGIINPKKSSKIAIKVSKKVLKAKN